MQYQRVRTPFYVRASTKSCLLDAVGSTRSLRRLTVDYIYSVTVCVAQSNLVYARRLDYACDMTGAACGYSEMKHAVETTVD